MFEDIITIEKIYKQLKIDFEELKDELQDYKGAVGVLNRQNRDMGYLLKEASFYIKEFEKTMPEDDFKKCETAGKKAYEDWLKKKFELSTPEVKATIQP